jgi:hypothetical protein
MTRINSPVIFVVKISMGWDGHWTSVLLWPINSWGVTCGTGCSNHWAHSVILYPFIHELFFLQLVAFLSTGIATSWFDRYLFVLICMSCLRCHFHFSNFLAAAWVLAFSHYVIFSLPFVSTIQKPRYVLVFIYIVEKPVGGWTWTFAQALTYFHLGDRN